MLVQPLIYINGKVKGVPSYLKWRISKFSQMIGRTQSFKSSRYFTVSSMGKMISSPTIVDMFPHQTFAWLETFCKLLDGLFLCPEWDLWHIETTSVKNYLLTSHHVFRFSHSSHQLENILELHSHVTVFFLQVLHTVEFPWLVRWVFWNCMLCVICNLTFLASAWTDFVWHLIKMLLNAT